MRNTEVVVQNYKTYRDTISARYMKDGKLDAKELNMVMNAILANQAALAMAIRDVYQAVKRVEGKVQGTAKRGPVGT